MKKIDSKQLYFAVAQVIIVVLFIALESYQLLRFGLTLQHAALLVLWLVCLVFVAKNLIKTLRVLKEQTAAEKADGDDRATADKAASQPRGGDDE